MTASPRALALVLLLAWPVQPLDDAARGIVQTLRRPALELPMRVVSDRSRVALVGIVAGALMSGAAGHAILGEAAVALLPVNAVVEGLKWSVARTRPDGDSNRRNSSFPSSHAANAFTLAALTARRWRRLALPVWLAAALVGFSRMYLDRHWLSDVLCSLVLALAGAWFSVWAISLWQQSRKATRVT